MAHKVQLALYDLSGGLAKSMSMAILGKQIDGIWHTGMIVYGKEYFFGGGLQCMPHEEFVRLHGGARPVEYIELGATDIPQDLFEDFNREVSPRFTAQTYDLMKHNCNNYTNEAAKFLLGKGIPSHIIDLPNEVLNSPMGGMLRPMLEQMTTQMNGADPYSAMHHRQQQAFGQPALGGTAMGASPMAAQFATAPSALPMQGTTAAVGAGSVAFTGPVDEFPILDKHSKPLVGSDTAKAAPNVAARLKSLGTGVDGLLSEEERAILDALPASLAAPKTSPVTPGSFRLVQKIISKGSAWPDKAVFLALVLTSLMVLHDTEGEEMGNAMAELSTRAQEEGGLLPQSLSMAICAGANSFGTDIGCRHMMLPQVVPGWIDAGLAALHPAKRGEVRQMASALLNNYSLRIAEGMPDKKEDEEVGDDVTQIVIGCLDGVGESEDSQTVALRRLISAGRLVRKLGKSGAEMVMALGLNEQVAIFCGKTPDGEAKQAAAEFSRLLQFLSSGS